MKSIKTRVRYSIPLSSDDIYLQEELLCTDFEGLFPGSLEILRTREYPYDELRPKAQVFQISRTSS